VHEIEIIDYKGDSLGKWPAFNNIDSGYAKKHYNSSRHLKNGTYLIQDQKIPTYKDPDANGPFGLHGIIHFRYKEHDGVGIHSGRLNHRIQPGPQHATHGCIRTSDGAMAEITKIMAKDPIKTISIIHNSSISVAHGHVKMQADHGHKVQPSHKHHFNIKTKAAVMGVRG
jgi:hypothetical protein